MDQATVQDYLKQLDGYKALLIDKYNQRDMALADRETLRFKLLVVWESRANSYLSKIENSFGSDPVMLEAFSRAIEGALKQNLPFEGINEATQGLEVATVDYLMKALESSNVGSVAGSLSQWFGGLSAVDPVIGNTYYFPPFTADNIFKSMAMRDAYFLSQWPDQQKQDFSSKVAALLQQDFGDGDWAKLVSEAKTMYQNLISLTNVVIELSKSIASIEATAKSFLDAFKQQTGVTIPSSTILNDLNQMPVGSTVITKAPSALVQDIPMTEGVNNTMAPSVTSSSQPVASKSKLPLLAAAAAGAYFLLG